MSMLSAEDLVKAYDLGASLAELAEVQGCAVGTVRDRLQRAGATLRKPGGRNHVARGNRGPLTPADWAARRLADDANVLTTNVLAELPPGTLDDLDPEIIDDLAARCLAVVIAAREPALAGVMARQGRSLLDDDGLYARTARKLARAAARKTTASKPAEPSTPPTPSSDARRPPMPRRRVGR